MAVGALVGAAVAAGVLGFLVGAGVDVEEDFGTLLVGVGVVLVLVLVFFWDSVSFLTSSFDLIRRCRRCFLCIFFLFGSI